MCLTDSCEFSKLWDRLFTKPLNQGDAGRRQQQKQGSTVFSASLWREKTRLESVCNKWIHNNPRESTFIRNTTILRKMTLIFVVHDFQLGASRMFPSLELKLPSGNKIGWSRRNDFDFTLCWLTGPRKFCLSLNVNCFRYITLAIWKWRKWPRCKRTMGMTDKWCFGIKWIDCIKMDYWTAPAKWS